MLVTAGIKHVHRQKEIADPKNVHFRTQKWEGP